MAVFNFMTVAEFERVEVNGKWVGEFDPKRLVYRRTINHQPCDIDLASRIDVEHLLPLLLRRMTTRKILALMARTIAEREANGSEPTSHSTLSKENSNAISDR